MNVQTLTNNNTYLGATDVSEGELHVAIGGVLSATSVANVDSAATLRVNGLVNLAAEVNVSGVLSGTGTVGNTNVLSGGSIAPGNSAGTINTGSLNQQANGHLSLELNGLTAGTYDRINVTGSVSLLGDLGGSTLTIAVSENVDIFYIILNDGSDAVVGGSTLFAGAHVMISGQPFEVSFDADAGSNMFHGGMGSNDVALLAIPEPNSLSMLAGSLGLALGLQRFRRRRQS